VDWLAWADWSAGRFSLMRWVVTGAKADASEPAIFSRWQMLMPVAFDDSK
jgi:hypothetical protein